MDILQILLQIQILRPNTPPVTLLLIQARQTILLPILFLPTTPQPTPFLPITPPTHLVTPQAEWEWSTPQHLALQVILPVEWEQNTLPLPATPPVQDILPLQHFLQAMPLPATPPGSQPTPRLSREPR